MKSEKLQLKNKKLPAGWRKMRLGNITGEVRDLYNPKLEEHLKYVGLEHIEQNALRLSDIGDSANTQSTKKTFLPNDVLFGSLRAYFRKVIKPSFKGVCSTDITVLRSKRGYDQNFLYYFIANPDFINFASASAEGTRMPRASWKFLAESKWLVPEYNEQKRIAEILSAFDDKIEVNNKINQTLEQTAQAIFKEWFSENQKSKIKNQKLSQLVKTQYGYTESASDKEIGPKFLRVTDINKTDWIDWNMVPYCKISERELPKYKLQNSDVVIARMADPGKVAIIEEDIDAVFASYLIRLQIISEDITPYFLFYYLRSRLYQDFIFGASTGTTRQSANARVITDIKIAIPPKDKVLQFENLVSTLRRKILANIKENQKLAALRDLLLPKLMSGKVRV